jgi:hypothetical protein
MCANDIIDLRTIDVQYRIGVRYKGVGKKYFGRNYAVTLDERNTNDLPGLYSISEPRRLNNQATSSSILITIPAAFFSASILRSALILSFAARPTELIR